MSSSRMLTHSELEKLRKIVIKRYYTFDKPSSNIQCYDGFKQQLYT